MKCWRHFDNETLTELLKGRVVTPTVRNDVTVKENVIQSKEPAIKILNPLEGLSEKRDTNSTQILTTYNDSDLVADLLDRNKTSWISIIKFGENLQDM